MKESADGCPMFEESDCNMLSGNMLSGEVMCSSISLNKANKLLRDWFNKQTVMYGVYPPRSGYRYDNNWTSDKHENDTHTARLIAVRPIEKDSFEKVVRDYIGGLDQQKNRHKNYDWSSLEKRARKLLSGED